jgi:hypothetical protein
MPSWTDSLESLRTLNFWLLILGGVAGVVTALSTCATIWTGSRIEQLQDAAEASRVVTQTVHDAAMKEELAESKQRLAELKQRQARRRLTDEQKQTLVVALSKASVRAPALDIVTVMGDSEGLAFSLELINALNEAGWPITDDHVSQAVFTTVPRGVILQVRNEGEPGAGLLQSALKSVGIDAPGELSESVPVGTVQIVVGSKLEP